MRTLEITAEMMAAHGEVITAWLSGSDVQVKTNVKGARWSIINPAYGTPTFSPNLKYRVSPYSFKDYARLKTFIDAYEAGQAIEVFFDGKNWELLKDPLWNAPADIYRISPYTYAQWQNLGDVIKAVRKGELVEYSSDGKKWDTFRPYDPLNAVFHPGVTYRVSPWTREQLRAHKDVIRAWERGEDVEFYQYGSWKLAISKSVAAPKFSPDIEYRIKPPVHKAAPKWAEVLTCSCGKHTLNVDQDGVCWLNGEELARDGEFKAADGTIYVVGPNSRICEIKKRAPYPGTNRTPGDSLIWGETEKVTITEEELTAGVHDEEIESAIGIVRPEPNTGVLLYATGSGEVYVLRNHNSPKDLEKVKKVMAEQTAAGIASDQVLLNALVSMGENNMSEYLYVHKLDDIVKTPAELNAVYHRVTGRNSPGATMFSRGPAQIPFYEKSIAFQNLSSAAKLEILRREATKLTKSGKSGDLRELLNNFHTVRLTNLNPHYYLRFAEELHKLLLKHNIC